MKPPRRVKVETSASAEPRTSSGSAIAIGRLVALLRGEGLTENTLRELLRPGSVTKLRGMLTDCPFPGRREQTPGPVRPEDGKLLAFKAREAMKL
jgi:hypothetical protein